MAVVDVGEIKKGRYAYNHCSAYKGRCPEPYVREEVLEAKFTGLLRQLTFDAGVMDWMRDALKESHQDEQQDRDEAIARLEGERRRLQHLLELARGAIWLSKSSLRSKSAVC
jgi:site-specific DNA recombinase